MTEETDVDDDVPFKGQAFLRLKELIFEACAATERYYGVFANHKNYLDKSFFIVVSVKVCQMSRETGL